MNTVLKTDRLDKRIESNLEILACYYVDVVYNKIYLDSQKLSKTGTMSLTDIYNSKICEYRKAADEKANNKKIKEGIFRDLYEYYKTHVNNITIGQFQDKIIFTFIPEPYNAEMNENDKLVNIFHIISRTIGRFFTSIIAERLPMIIDDHKNHLNVRVLQDSVIGIMLDIRGEYAAAFERRAPGSSSGAPLISETELKKLVETRDHFEAVAKKAIVALHDATAYIKELTAQNSTMAARIDDLQYLQTNKNEKQIAKKHEIEKLKQENRELAAENTLLISQAEIHKNNLKRAVEENNANIRKISELTRELAKLTTAQSISNTPPTNHGREAPGIYQIDIEGAPQQSIFDIDTPRDTVYESTAQETQSGNIDTTETTARESLDDEKKRKLAKLRARISGADK